LYPPNNRQKQRQWIEVFLITNYCWTSNATC